MVMENVANVADASTTPSTHNRIVDVPAAVVTVNPTARSVLSPTVEVDVMVATAPTNGLTTTTTSCPAEFR